MQSNIENLPPAVCTLAEFQAWKEAQNKPQRQIPTGYYNCVQLAAKFDMTARNIRKLCKLGRFKGAKLDSVHGWLIPYGTAPKRGKRGPTSKVTAR